ncbi:Ribonuclease P protein component [hydrothermal vent metagenome]|uniref:Ribonuclease P protein component n=1 Tax=hydrothermal vent metagenome TaxID=652676 RepID=A0A3B0R3B8_9ZZZZ
MAITRLRGQGWQENSFKREERLLRKKDFLKIRKKGIRLLTGSFIIFAHQSDLGFNRLGIAASTRVGNSVKRNRIKRLLREFFRLNKNIFPESTDIFISVKKEARVEKLSDVEFELTPVMKKLCLRQTPAAKKQ